MIPSTADPGAASSSSNLYLMVTMGLRPVTMVSVSTPVLLAVFPDGVALCIDDLQAERGGESRERKRKLTSMAARKEAR
jgi:hypothetical protein